MQKGGVFLKQLQDSWLQHYVLSDNLLHWGQLQRPCLPCPSVHVLNRHRQYAMQVLVLELSKATTQMLCHLLHWCSKGQQDALAVLFQDKSSGGVTCMLNSTLQAQHVQACSDYTQHSFACVSMQHKTDKKPAASISNFTYKTQLGHRFQHCAGFIALTKCLKLCTPALGHFACAT